MWSQGLFALQPHYTLFLFRKGRLTGDFFDVAKCEQIVKLFNKYCTYQKILHIYETIRKKKEKIKKKTKKGETKWDLQSISRTLKNHGRARDVKLHPTAPSVQMRIHMEFNVMCPKKNPTSKSTTKHYARAISKADNIDIPPQQTKESK